MGDGTSSGDMSTSSSTGSGPAQTASPTEVSTTSASASVGDTVTTEQIDSTGAEPTGVAGPSVGVACRPYDPREVPDPPDGCEHMYPVDPQTGNVRRNMPTGKVTCAGRGPNIYRLTDVSCPFSTGECQCDAHCADGEACDCSVKNTCVEASCRGAADCPDGACRKDIPVCGFGFAPGGFYCTDSESSCQNNDDCTESWEACIHWWGQEWNCFYEDIPCE
jgi:hypothetical protein